MIPLHAILTYKQTRSSKTTPGIEVISEKAVTVVAFDDTTNQYVTLRGERIAADKALYLKVPKPSR